MKVKTSQLRTATKYMKKVIKYNYPDEKIVRVVKGKDTINFTCWDNYLETASIATVEIEDKFSNSPESFMTQLSYLSDRVEASIGKVTEITFTPHGSPADNIVSAAVNKEIKIQKTIKEDSKNFKYTFTGSISKNLLQKSLKFVKRNKNEFPAHALLHNLLMDEKALVATDGHILFKIVKYGDDLSLSGKRFLVYKRVVEALASQRCPNWTFTMYGKEPRHMEFTGNLRDMTLKLTTHCIEKMHDPNAYPYKFPNYDNAIPSQESYGVTLKFNNNALKDGLNKTNECLNQDNIRLHRAALSIWPPETMWIEPEPSEGRMYSERIPVNIIQGEKHKDLEIPAIIGVNPDLLLRTLDCIREENVVLHMSPSTRGGQPIVVMGEKNKTDEAIYLVMPMKLD